MVKKGHEINPDLQIGAMCAMVPFYPVLQSQKISWWRSKRCAIVTSSQM
ncbi:hypothetical protein OK016_26620 [Vibrio chagasii]|nr:hypothetical protein [Vibrio chagasii]